MDWQLGHFHANRGPHSSDKGDDLTFVLKGALLSELWTHRPHRPTRDLDLEDHGENSSARIKRLFAEIIR